MSSIFSGAFNKRSKVINFLFHHASCNTCAQWFSGRRMTTMSTSEGTISKAERLHYGATHLFDGTQYNVYDKNIINLSVGAPGPDLLLKCCELFKRATDHRMEYETGNLGSLFQYGSAIGNIDIRSNLADFLSKVYCSDVHRDDLVITNGATYGLHQILSTLIDLNGVIFVDEVIYMIALEMFEQFTGLIVVPVKLTEFGVDTKHLEDLLKQHIKKNDKKKLFGALYYTVPTYHNPTGILFSEDVCRKLISLARQYEVLIVCDDVYNLLNYNTATPPKRLYAYDDFDGTIYKGNVISNGSFSKIIAPGTRLGWMECPPRCVSTFNSSGILKSGGCPSNYSSGILQSLLELGLAQSHIKDLAEHYKSRMEVFCNVLQVDLPVNCKFNRPGGGYFIWIILPENISATLLNQFCVDKYKINFIPGSTFSTKGDFSNCLRVSIAFHPKNVLENAAKKLCIAIKEFCKLH